MREEAKKLEEFREKQKEARKKVCGFISNMKETSCYTNLQGDLVISDWTTDGYFA